MPDNQTTSPDTLEWRDADQLDPAIRALLMGPGAPFELAIEDVLGAPAQVFVQRPKNLPSVIRRAADQYGDKIYLVSPEDEEITYAQALERITKIAWVLQRDYGVAKGDRVAFASANTVEYILTLWAAITLGAILVNLNAWWTPAELAYGIDLTDPIVILGDDRRLEGLAKLPPRESGSWPPLDNLSGVLIAARSLDGTSTPLATVDIDEDDPLTILFTSGTTGRSKGATLTHRNGVHLALASMLAGTVRKAASGALMGGTAQDPQPASILGAPLFHMSGLAPLFNAPFAGLKLTVPPTGRWDETRILQIVERHHITSLAGVPTQFWRILQHPDFETFDTSSVQTLAGGGATCPPELARLMRARFPKASGAQGYGMTETTAMGTRLAGAVFDQRPETVGTAEATMRIQVRDPAGQALPPGEIGEVYIWGAGVFRGYWNNDSATAEVLDAERWYRTGDFGRLDGELLILESRMRDLIIRGGENIYPIEIENRLVEHPEIADAAVIGVDHPTLGQEVKAFVVPMPNCSPSADEVRRFVGEALAGFKVPAHVTFRESLPYSRTGKVLKRELEDHQQVPA